MPELIRDSQFPLANRFGINRNTLYQRLFQGWSIEEALKTPVQIHVA
jgi:hypothetical protein